jgi:hypothetical protein
MRQLNSRLPIGRRLRLVLRSRLHHGRARHADLHKMDESINRVIPGPRRSRSGG